MLAAFSCTREIELEVIPVETSEEATQAKVYTLAVHAEKGDAETKALDLSSDGKTLTASWKEGEEVDLYKGDDKIGTLVAQSAGTTTTLKGTITETLALGDQLALRFCSPNYNNQGGTLYIHCQSYDSDMGKLIADNSDKGTGAGIGCKDGDGEANHPGTIIIHGGDITAKGGTYAAGIGGGEDRPSGTITIWGGTITALADGGSDCYGAGIGSGDFCDYSGEDVDNYQITIHGGNITARGGGWNSALVAGGGAGIGGGRFSRPGTIVINGGTIYAQGTYSERHDESGQYVDHYYFDGRGIGSGGEGKVGTVTINGGTITAVSYRGRHWDQGGAFDKSGLTLASHLKVRGGDDESSATEATTLEGRYDKCYHDKWVRIEP